MTSTRASTFRPDVEGLRALAVLMVLLYHAEVPGFAGGYVGVDVFLVLSGFLITGLLAAQLEGGGTIRLREFYARRVRRLLPASTLVALVTLMLIAVVMPPLQIAEARTEALATVTYWANVHFALAGIDYQLADAAPSAFQHYWSLAVEEQFYLLWPLLLLATHRVSQRLDRDPRRATLVLLASVVTVSFTLSIVVTAWRQPWAFFLLPTRAWELAAGGLLAMSLSGTAIPRRWSASVAMALGLGCILLATVLFDERTPFPGWAAVVPAVGTLLALWAGRAPGPLQAALSARPVQAIGRRSYSLYLWHWPLLVLTDGIPGGELAMRWRVLVLAVASLLAFVTFRLVEDPVRRSPALARRPVRSFALGAAGTAGSIVFVVAVTTPTAMPSNAPLAATSATTTVAELFTAPTPVVPADLRPALDAAHGEDADPVDDPACHLDTDNTEISDDGCVYGDPGGSESVVLVGDSHALHWFAALDRIAVDQGWRLISLTKNSCPAYDVPVFSSKLNREYVECERWREGVIARINAEQPAMVVMSNLGHGGSAPRPPLSDWLAGLERTVAQLPDETTPVVFGQNPYMPQDVPECLSAHLSDTDACAAPADEAIDADLREGERSTAQAVGATYIDTTGLVCRSEMCPPIVGNLLVYRDRHHLSGPFAAALAPELSALLPAVAARTD